jgi:hypothetical protein
MSYKIADRIRVIWRFDGVIIVNTAIIVDAYFFIVR